MKGDGAEAALPSVPNGQRSSVAPHSAPGQAVQKSSLILPVWDVPPPKPLHPSHDLISLLSLASLYNSYVRPYASGVDDDSVPGGAVVDGEGVKNEPMGSAGLAGRAKGGVPQRQKGTRLERGYTSLLDDCIDPVPEGNYAAPSLMPLIKDMTYQPTGPPPEIWDGPIEIWPVDKWNVATLEVGSQSGYKGGVKEGVQKAEEKRQRKREARLALQLPSKLAPGDTSNPTFDPLTPGPQSAPGTPLLPVPPPSRAGVGGFAARRQDSTSGAGPSRPPPINPALAGSVPGPSSGSAGFRPNSGRPSAPESALPGGVKRVYEGQGAGMSKKAKVAGTRSASPMPTSAVGKSAQGQGKTQPRPGLGKGGRARTEGM